MAGTVQVKCACGTMFTARVADRKRGWAKSCSKSCAAIKREKKTGTYAAYQQRQARRYSEEWHDEAMTAMEEGWDGHKVWTGTGD